MAACCSVAGAWGLVIPAGGYRAHRRGHGFDPHLRERPRLHGTSAAAGVRAGVGSGRVSERDAGVSPSAPCCPVPFQPEVLQGSDLRCLKSDGEHRYRDLPVSPMHTVPPGAAIRDRQRRSGAGVPQLCGKDPPHAPISLAVPQHPWHRTRASALVCTRERRFLRLAMLDRQNVGYTAAGSMLIPRSSKSGPTSYTKFSAERRNSGRKVHADSEVFT